MEWFKEFLMEQMERLNVGDDSLTEVGKRELALNRALYDYVSWLSEAVDKHMNDAYVLFLKNEIATLKEKEETVGFANGDSDALAVYETCLDVYMRMNEPKTTIRP